jgi:hypothetical protein
MLRACMKTMLKSKEADFEGAGKVHLTIRRERFCRRQQSNFRPSRGDSAFSHHTYPIDWHCHRQI